MPEGPETHVVRGKVDPRVQFDKGLVMRGMSTPRATTGTGGPTGERQHGGRVAEHGRFGHQVSGRGAAEAADWVTAFART